MRQRARVDSNHAAIVGVLRATGCKVQSLAAVGKGVPDLLVGTPRGELILLEVKDGARKPSEQELNDAQKRWFNEWQAYPIYIVNSPKSALFAVQTADGT